MATLLFVIITFNYISIDHFLVYGNRLNDLSEYLPFSQYLLNFNANDLALYLDISDKEAFDINREEFLIDNNYKIVNVNKHNSLFDAYIIKEIYNVVHGLRS